MHDSILVPTDGSEGGTGSDAPRREPRGRL